MCNRLALGTVQFGQPYGIANKKGQISSEEVGRIIHYARQHGISTLDTAIAYGESEKVLGLTGVGDFRIISKLPVMPKGEHDIESWVITQVEQSLARLGIAKLGGLLLHNTSALQGDNGKSLAKSLHRIKEEGLVAGLGISIYSPDEIKPALDMLEIQIVQAPFNLLDRRLEESGWLDRLQEADIEIHVRSVFLQGLLLIQDLAIRNRFRHWNVLWAKWDQWLADKSLSPASACLAFAESIRQLKKIIVGVDSVDQLRELVENSGSLEITDFPDIACNDIALINPSRWNLN